MMPTTLPSRVTGRPPTLLSIITRAASSMGVSSAIVITFLLITWLTLILLTR